MTEGIATGVFPISGTDQQAVTQNTTAVFNNRADSESKVDAAFAPVLANHDLCKTLAPLISCVKNGATTAKNAVQQVPNPIQGKPAGMLDAVVGDMIAAALAKQPSPAMGCNDGVQLLADAAALIDQQAAAADLGTLQTCVNELASVAPGDPNLTAGQQALGSANAAIGAAKALLDPTNPTTHAVWENRLVCSITSSSVTLHVTDESGDDFGSGAKVSLTNFPLSTMVPNLPSPTIPTGTDSSGRITIGMVPFAPMPLTVPANAPKAPTDLPTSDAATLVFTVTRQNRKNGSAIIPVDHTGVNFEVQIPIADTSI